MRTMFWTQFMVFTMATIWLIQKGSAESKRPEEAGLQSDRQQRVGGYADARSPAWAKVEGLRRRIYENSFVIVMTAIFLASWYL